MVIKMFINAYRDQLAIFRVLLTVVHLIFNQGKHCRLRLGTMCSGDDQGPDEGRK